MTSENEYENEYENEHKTQTSMQSGISSQKHQKSFEFSLTT